MAFIVQNSRERGRVSQYTHATRERIGNAHSAAFCFLALWSGEVFVDRFREQSEPPFEIKKFVQNNAVLSIPAHDGTGNGLHPVSVFCNGEFPMLSDAGLQLVRPIR